jgi:prepilin-type N-terminal cleavage/methylation domain-containing protein
MMAQRAMFNKKGMTLIEIMIALVILLFASLALMKIAVLTISTNVQNVVRDEAVNAAETRMNDLRSVPFDNIETAATATVISRNVRNFTVNYNIPTPAVTPINANCKQITISVAWSYRGQAYTHSITTILRKQ